MRASTTLLLLATVALLGGCDGGSRGRSAGCGHVYVADPVYFYGGYYGEYGYDPYYEDPSYWSYDSSYDDTSGDPGAGDPGYSDPPPDPPPDEPASLHPRLTPKGAPAADAGAMSKGPDVNGCYACVLECDVTTSAGRSQEIANGVSGFSEERACSWAKRAMDSWAVAHAATVGTCLAIDPRRGPAAAAPALDDASDSNDASDANAANDASDARPGDSGDASSDADAGAR